MFFFPYGTDAPIYYWPVTTVIMIVVNCLVFVLELAYPEFALQLVLEHGNGLHPLQWLTCNFAHAGLMHLVVNMVFLWSFGLIVEGKLGWWKTLATYVGIGILHGAIVQVLMLGTSSGGSLGASAAIFGLMAMTLIWAPENEMTCVLVFYILFFVRIVFVEVRILVMVGVFLLLQIVVVIVTSGAMSSEFLHATGAAVGFPIAIWMLKAGIVDCENWDLFSVISGRHKMTPEERIAAEMKSPAFQKQRAEEHQTMRGLALEQIPELVASGQAELAIKAHQRMLRDLPGWFLPEPELQNLILALHERKQWTESLPIMKEYLSQYPEKAAVMRLRLARIFAIEQHRPAQALKVLERIDEAALGVAHREYLGKLREKAEQLRQRGVDEYEVVEDGW